MECKSLFIKGKPLKRWEWCRTSDGRRFGRPLAEVSTAADEYEVTEVPIGPLPIDPLPCGYF